MLTYFLVKPGGAHLLPLISNCLSEMYTESNDADLSSCIKLVNEGVDILQGRATTETSRELVYVGTGLISRKLLSKIYPDPPEGEAGENMRKIMLDKPYGLIMLDVDPEIRDALVEVKGKFMTDNPSEELGLRGKMRERYKEIGSIMSFPEEQRMPGLGENFVHTPDTEQESRELYRYIASNLNGEEKHELVNSIKQTNNTGAERNY